MIGLTAAAATTMIHETALRLVAAATELSRLDAIAGDGDHGVNMAATFTVADSRITEASPETAAEVFRLVGRAFEESGSGSAGALFGAFFGAFSERLERSDGDVADYVDALDGATGRVASLGRATIGDKTMLDALRPAVDAARVACADGSPLEDVLLAASHAAAAGAEATAGMPARAGRARYAPDGAIVDRDPGAVTIALMFGAWADTVGDQPAHPVKASV
jgi:phosphoenolpyruvate---glycerone phosphotransferase subunit DhaL